MIELLKEIIRDPIAALIIIGNLVLIESLLSIDNAAILSTMVINLPRNERRKALNYGIIGAYLFRGACILLATFLIRIWWLKAAGGFYLIYLFIKWLRKIRSKLSGKPLKNNQSNLIHNFAAQKLGNFWATVISVELMDLAFSMDNVFAAVAFSSNIIIILCGVFIGILAMRMVAQGFVKLMERYPFLENCAYLVIGILGIKLLLSVYTHFCPYTSFTRMLNSHAADWATSALTLSVFLIPTLSSLLFNFPSRATSKK